MPKRINLTSPIVKKDLDRVQLEKIEITEKSVTVYYQHGYDDAGKFKAQAGGSATFTGSDYDAFIAKFSPEIVAATMQHLIDEGALAGSLV